MRNEELDATDRLVNEQRTAEIEELAAELAEKTEECRTLEIRLAEAQEQRDYWEAQCKRISIESLRAARAGAVLKGGER